LWLATKLFFSRKNDPANGSKQQTEATVRAATVLSCCSKELIWIRHFEGQSMSTKKQIAANRQNAQRSTGPRTADGKSKVCMNALKHGLTATQLILPDENAEEYESFRAALLADFGPEGAVECAWADVVVRDLWRLRRVPIMEAKLYQRGVQESVVRRAAAASAQYETTSDQFLRSFVENKQVAPENVEAHKHAEQKLASARAELDDSSLDVTHALEMFLPYFSHIYRHENALSRSALRHQHELERMRAKRAGERVRAPSVVDVNINLPEHQLPVEGPDGE
jgi:hypothetical protein